MRKLERNYSGTRKMFRIMSVILILCMLMSTVSLQRILADEPAKLSKESLIPSSVVVSAPIALSNISLPQSEYGSLAWENGSAVPNSYEGTYAVIFKSNGRGDLSQISGYDAGSGTLKGTVRVVVKSLEPTPTATPSPTAEVTPEVTVQPTQTPVPETTEEPEETPAPENTGEPDKNTGEEPSKDSDGEDSEKEDAADEGKDSEDGATEENGDSSSDGEEEQGELGKEDTDDSDEQPDDQDSEKNEPDKGSEDGEKEESEGEENSGEDADQAQTDTDEDDDEKDEAADDIEEGINDITEEDLKEVAEEQPQTVDPEAVPQDQATVATQNHTCNGINVSGDFLPWYVQFRVSSGDGYEFSNESEANIFQSYELELWDLMNNQPYEIPEGKYVTVSILVREGYEYTIEHLLEDGSSETIIPTVYGSTMVFSVDSFSPFGIAGSKPLVGDEIAENGYKKDTPTPTAKPSAGTSDRNVVSEKNSGAENTENINYNESNSSSKNSSSVERTVTYKNTTAKAVQTGDTTAILPFVILAIAGLVVVAAIVIIILVLNSKRRK